MWRCVRIAGGFAAVLLLAFRECAGEDWWLWPSPFGNTEAADQSQTLYAGYSGMMNEHGVGQSFTPAASPLTRMDFLIYNRRDLRPFRLRLWKWNADYATTVAQTPLFEDTVSVPGHNLRNLCTFFPRIPVETGRLYYVEFRNDTGDGEWAIYRISDGVDHYADGQLRVNNVSRDTMDLYFATYTEPLGEPQTPPFSASDPSLAWDAPDPPGLPPCTNDYLNVVKQRADAARDYYLTRVNRYCDRHAILEAFLHRATGEEIYALNAAQMLENALAYRQQNPDEHIGFTRMEYPGYAYLWIRDAPGLTAGQHAQIRELLLDYARAFWPVRELGIMNRSLGGCLTYKLITALWDDMPEYAEWTAYADDIWAEFLAHLDTDEDSGHYNWLSWRYLLQLIDLYGADDLWHDPSFRALVERFFEQGTPLGPGPSQGDSNGWGVSWCMPVWLFEKAAAVYGEAKFRWRAYRCFDYQRQHIKNLPLQEAVYSELHALCFAYFDTDSALEAVPPPPRGEREAAAQTIEAGAPYAATNGWPVGQIFTPTASPLARLDVLARRGGVETNAVLKLWKWKTDYAGTVAQPPLFQDAFSLPADPEIALRCSLYPLLDVQTGALYYAEFSSGDNAGGIVLLGSQGETNRYPGGALYRNGSWSTQQDLWFETFTLDPGGSAWGTRQKVTPLRVSQRGSPSRATTWDGERVPDKLTLRSGHEPDGLTVVVNLLCGNYGHGHAETGAILAMTDNGSLLYADGTYGDKDLKDHCAPVGRRYWGGTFVGQAERSDIVHFSDARRVAVARIGWNDPAGWNFRQERLLFLVKNRFLLVRDRMRADGAMQAGFGHVWHAHDLHPEHGGHWYSLYNREPLGINGWLYRNPERYLLLYMIPRGGRETAAWKHDYSGNPPCAPYIVWQRFAGEMAAGESVWADAVLFPYGPELTPAEAAARVSVLHDDGANLAVEVRIEDEVWTILNNEGVHPIDLLNLGTDGDYAVVCSSAGRMEYLLTHNASRVLVGESLRAWPVATSAEIGGSPPETHELDIRSAHGAPDPAPGVWTNLYGTHLTAGVDTAIVQGGTQYVCTGWSLSGNVPHSGATNRFALTHTNRAELVWQWSTNYWLEITTHGCGTVDGASGWYASGTTVSLTATPCEGRFLAGWEGHTNDSVFAGETLVIDVDRPRAIAARFRHPDRPASLFSVK